MAAFFAGEVGCKIDAYTKAFFPNALSVCFQVLADVIYPFNHLGEYRSGPVIERRALD